jgi:hypothetical protein
VSPPLQAPEAFGTHLVSSSPSSPSGPSGPSSPPTLVSLVVSSPKETSSVLHISEGLIHYLQWSLFDLLYYPPFIFWSSIFLLAKKDCPSSNHLPCKFLPPRFSDSAREVNIS